MNTISGSPLLALGFALLAGCSGSSAKATELFTAIGNDDERAVELIERYGLVDRTGPLIADGEGPAARHEYTPLHKATYVAAWNGDTRVVAALLEHGADVNAPGPGGCTPLDMLVGDDPANPDVGDLIQFRDRVLPRSGRLVALLESHGAEGAAFRAARDAYDSRPAGDDMLGELRAGILGY